MLRLVLHRQQRQLQLTTQELKRAKGYKKIQAGRGKTHHLVSKKQGFEKERLDAKANEDLVKQFAKGNYQSILANTANGQGGIVSVRGAELNKRAEIRGAVGRTKGELRQVWGTITTRSMDDTFQIDKIPRDVAWRYAKMIMYREQIPRQVDVSIPLEVILPPGLSPEAKALRQLPENRSDEDNELVQRQGNEMLDIMAAQFAELDIDVIGKRNSGLGEYRLTVRPSPKFIAKHRADDSVMSSPDVTADDEIKKPKKKKPKKKKTKKLDFNESAIFD